MNSDNIHILQNNEIRYFDLKANFNEYIQSKQDDYLKELSINNFVINKWRKLELITAYKHEALMYEDVPEYIKELYLLPTRDEGIDVIKFDNESNIIEVFQCKDYNGRVENSELCSFFRYSESRKFKNVKFTLVGGNKTVFNKTQEYITYNTNEIFEHSLEDTKKTLKLREYQKEAINKIINACNDEIKSINIKMPCGTGKSMLFYYFGKKCKDKTILIMVPKISIAQQIEQYFNKILHKEINCYWTETHKNKSSNVTVCVYNSVNEIIDNEYDMTFIDEAHHIVGSDIYIESLIESEIDPNTITEFTQSDYVKQILNIKTSIFINLSATIDITSEYDYEYSFINAINDGYLVEYEVDLLKVDYNLINQFNKLKEIINTNPEYKHIIIYCNSIKTSDECAKYLNDNGIISYSITSKNTILEREHYLNDFRNNLVKVITTVNCLNEGTNITIADTCIFLDDRASDINIIQSVGRLLRIHEFKNKAKIVLLDIDDDSFKINYYLRALNKYDDTFKYNLNRRLKLYNYSNKDINMLARYKHHVDIIKQFKTKSMFKQMTYKEKIIKCQQFKDKYDRKPNGSIEDRLLAGFNIYDFINNCKRNKIKQTEVEKIFGYTKKKEIVKTDPEYHSTLIAEYVKETGEFPKSHNVYREGVDISNKFNLAKRAKHGPEKELKRLIELKTGLKVPDSEDNRSDATEDDYFESIERFYKAGKKIIQTTKDENGLPIGSFRSDCYNGKCKIVSRCERMRKLDEKYNQIYKHSSKRDISLDEKYDIIVKYYLVYSCLPPHNSSAPEFEGHSVGKWMNNFYRASFRNKHPDFIKKIEDIPKLYGKK